MSCEYVMYHIPCGRKCKWWNKDKRRCECKNHNTCEKDYIWNVMMNY